MMLIKWLLFISLISAIKGLPKLRNLENFSVSERTMKEILESCYKNRDQSNPIVIFGDFHEFIDKSSIIRMNNYIKVSKDFGKHQLLNFEASKIVLNEYLPEQLHAHLILLKKTKWWNHMAPVFIVAKNTKTCGNFKEILTTAWRMDVINPIYICFESKNTSTLYTLNPIANYAPFPWKRMDDVEDLNVFHQLFDPDISCETINYDKTKFSNGFKIRGSYKQLPGTVYEPGKDYFEELPSEPEFNAFRSIVKALNISLTVEKETSEYPIIYERLSFGALDLILNLIPLETAPQIPFLFPHFWGQQVAVVKLNDEISTLYKILHLWRPSVLILAFVILAILTAILALENRDSSSGILDTIRLLTYVSIRTNIRHESFRIFFTTVLILMIISNGVFQSKISTFLLKNERKEIIGNVHQLIELGYKLYTPLPKTGFMKSKCPKCNLTVISQEACLDYVLNSTFNACVVRKTQYEKFYILSPVDYVTRPLSETYLTHKCRNNWPFRDRINDMLLRLFEFGLFDFWKMEKTRHSIGKRRANDAEFNHPQHRRIKFTKLDFAFQLLAIGLSFSTIVFLLEFLVAKWKDIWETILESVIGFRIRLHQIWLMIL